jgi:iron uptake system EfeUOB component EfeO/EfeM
MMNFKKLFMVSSLGIVLTFAGCGTQKAEQASNSTQNQTKQEAPAEKQKTLTIQEGSNNMKEVIKQMKTELNNKEEDKVIKTSEGLEGNWKIFEDNVKEKYFTLYEKVEDPLHTITAAVKVKPLDVNVMNTAMENLDKQLDQVKLADLTTTGIQNMRDVSKKMKEQLANKEEDNAIKTSEGLEGNWKQFEDNIKAKSPALYEKIEEPLHTITAAVKVKPLDANVLNTALDALDKQLEQYQQSDLVSTGTQNMRDALKKMKNKIAQNDEERTIKTSAYLEINWKKFEDNVKVKSPELYEKIEEPLKSINAAVKVKPLDTKTLNTNIDNLDKQLEQLQKLQF